MKHFKQYYAFYVPYIFFVITLFILIVNNEKADLHLRITSFNSQFGDSFFRYYTNVGGSLPYVVITGLLFYRYRIALFLLITQLTGGLVSQIIKQTWIESRPIRYFADNYPQIQLHQVKGVDLYSWHSFPSGHTITAFAFFLALAFFTKHRKLHFLYFMLAMLVGYSRIYLSQHFALDVLTGSIIGLLVTASWQMYFQTLPLKWADGSLRNVFSKKKR